MTRYRKFYDYLKKTFYYEYYTYYIHKSKSEIIQILYNGFEKRKGWFNISNIDGQLVDEDNFYIQFTRSEHHDYDLIKFLSPTCLKGIISEVENKKQVKIEIGVRPKTDYLIIFATAFLFGIIGTVLAYKDAVQRHMFILAPAIAAIVMIVVMGSASISKQKIKKSFEAIIETTPAIL